MGEMFGEKRGGLEIWGGGKVSAGLRHSAQSAPNLQGETSPNAGQILKNKTKQNKGRF